jgi:hypothetical protein
MSASIAIPYEKQSDPQINRGCGAACLSMVYRSFGKEVPQAEIWPLIAKQNRFGSIASTTHLMALHALSQGLQAIVIQTRHPLQVLRLCREGGIRAILNLRLQADASVGHYAVLVDIDDKSVVLHDPLLGPARCLTHAELLRLWHSQVQNSEILGNVLIGIAAEPAVLPPCEFCHTRIPATVDCPRCKKTVGLQPGVLMGCIQDGCIARMWNYVCCPSCDYLWSFDEAGTSAASFPNSTGSKPERPVDGPQNFDAIFAELDKFYNYALSIPGAAEHPELKTHLDFLMAGKEKLRLAQSEELAYQKIRDDQLAALKQESKQEQEAHRKKVEELNTPPPPLDGNALGDALLKNLGFK